MKGLIKKFWTLTNRIVRFYTILKLSRYTVSNIILVVFFTIYWRHSSKQLGVITFLWQAVCERTIKENFLLIRLCSVPLWVASIHLYYGEIIMIPWLYYTMWYKNKLYLNKMVMTEFTFNVWYKSKIKIIKKFSFVLNSKVFISSLWCPVKDDSCLENEWPGNIMKLSKEKTELWLKQTVVKLTNFHNSDDRSLRKIPYKALWKRAL